MDTKSTEDVSSTASLLRTSEPVGQMLLDADGRCLQADPGALRLVGLDADALVNRPVWRTGAWTDGNEALLERACREGAAGKAVRFRLGSDDDRTEGPEFTLDPIADSTGRVTHLLLTARPLGEELRRHAAEGAAEALMTMGRYATRMAHEINNPLASIRNSFLLVKEGLASTHPYYRYVGAIDRELNRLTAISQQLYDVYRLSLDVDPDTSAAAVVNDVVEMLCQRFRTAAIEVDLAPATEKPLAVPGLLLRQMVYSILLNAIEMVPDGGRIQVQGRVDAGTLVLSVRGPTSVNPLDILTRVTEPARGSRRYTRSADIGLDLPLFRHSAHALKAALKVVEGEAGGEIRLEIPVP